MQDRYAGDAGDFGKLGLLKMITSTNLRLGVNWYLVENESHNDDGKHKMNTLKEYADCDLLLAQKLETITNTDRAVANLEKMDYLPYTTYFNDRLIESGDIIEFRKQWHQKALSKLQDCDIVFLDPDNGLKVKSVGKGSKKSIKYVLDNEIYDYCSRGQSVIFYNHRKRMDAETYFKEFSDFFHQSRFQKNSWYALTFHKGSLRDYFIIAQPEHIFDIESVMNKITNEKWGKVFSREK